MKSPLIALFLAVALSVSAERSRFDHYRVYSIDIETHDQLTALKVLEETSDSYSFWESPKKIGTTIEVVVPPHKRSEFGELADKLGFKIELTHANFQYLIDRESPPLKQAKAPGDMDWIQYHSHEDINFWLDALAVEFPAWITVTEIGRSLQGRPLKVAKLSKQPGNRAIMIEANIHAREWIAGSAATYFLNELLRSNDPDIQFLALNIDWHILPISNPDGYEFTRTDNRMWRKTRSVTSLTCYGVDPNRNFAYNWLQAAEDGDEGASRSPCSDTYAGPSAFSEPETQAIENYLLAHPDEFDIFLAYHSYGHWILHPWGTTFVPVSNVAAQTAIGEAAAAALYTVHGTRYITGSAIEKLYAASGDSPDHAFGAHGIPITYTFEMRGNGDYGRYGFVLPPEHIKPNGEEMVRGMYGMVMKARDLGFLQN